MYCYGESSDCTLLSAKKKDSEKKEEVENSLYEAESEGESEFLCKNENSTCVRKINKSHDQCKLLNIVCSGV